MCTVPLSLFSILFRFLRILYASAPFRSCPAWLLVVPVLICLCSFLACVAPVGFSPIGQCSVFIQFVVLSFRSCLDSFVPVGVGSVSFLSCLASFSFCTMSPVSCPSGLTPCPTCPVLPHFPFLSYLTTFRFCKVGFRFVSVLFGFLSFLYSWPPFDFSPRWLLVVPVLFCLFSFLPCLRSSSLLSCLASFRFCTVGFHFVSVLFDSRSFLYCWIPFRFYPACLLFVSVRLSSASFLLSLTLRRNSLALPLFVSNLFGFLSASVLSAFRFSSLPLPLFVSALIDFRWLLSYLRLLCFCTTPNYNTIV